MNSNIRFNEKGLTLVELLATIVISSVIFILIINTLISGMTSYKSVNKQISLHDEGNYVMTQFINQIYVATNVKLIDSANDASLIEVTGFNGDKTILGFKDGKAEINGESINPTSVQIACDESKIVIDNNNFVIINMVIQDESGKRLQLNNKVSFVKVAEETGELK